MMALQEMAVLNDSCSKKFHMKMNLKVDDFLNSYDVIRGNMNAIKETYSSIQKGMKENQERTNGDYYLTIFNVS